MALENGFRCGPYSLLIEFGCGMVASMVCWGPGGSSSNLLSGVENKKIMYLLSYTSIASSNGILVN